METLDEFAAEVRQETSLLAGADPSPNRLEESFVEWALGQLADHNEADNADIVGYRSESRGRWPAAKLNAWALSGDGATLDLFVARYHGTDSVTTVGLP